MYNGVFKMYGKELRLRRLFHLRSDKTVIVPIDHGTTNGPLEGIKDYLSTIKGLVTGGADAVIMHKGLLRMITRYPELAKGRYILHLSVSTIVGPDPSFKVLVSSVEEAIKLGADGVSVHINLGTVHENDMIKDLGKIARACMEWGMPLLAMVYTCKSGEKSTYIAHAARLAEELGADIVKVEYPGKMKEMESIVKSVQIPVIVAGGVKTDNYVKLLEMVNDVLAAGAAGVAFGRNIFQYRQPELITNIISKLVHGEWQLQECICKIQEMEGRQ